MIRRGFQSLVALFACGVVAAWLGGYYLVPAIAATLVAMSTGVYIALAVGVGLVWPVLGVAYALHVTRDLKLRASQPAHDGSRRPPTGKPGVFRVEDP